MVWIFSAGSISAVAVAAAVVLTPVMRLAAITVLHASAQRLRTVMVVLGRTRQVRARGCGLHMMRLVLTGLVAPFVS